MPQEATNVYHAEQSSKKKVLQEATVFYNVTAAVVLRNLTCYNASFWHAIHVQSGNLIAKLL